MDYFIFNGQFVIQYFTIKNFFEENIAQKKRVNTSFYHLY